MRGMDLRDFKIQLAWVGAEKSRAHPKILFPAHP